MVVDADGVVGASVQLTIRLKLRRGSVEGRVRLSGHALRALHVPKQALLLCVGFNVSKVTFGGDLN